MSEQFYVEIISYDTGEAIKKIGPCDSERKAIQVEKGANINLNHDEYFTAIAPIDELTTEGNAHAD